VERGETLDRVGSHLMPSAAVSGCADPPPAATEPLAARTVTRRARDTATGTDRWRSVSAASPAGRAVTRADDGCSTDARVAVRRGANVVAAHDVGCKLVASIKPLSLSRRCTRQKAHAEHRSRSRARDG